MTRRLAPLAIAAALLALSVSACGISFSDDGPYTQQNRQVGGFDRLEVHGSADVVVRPGQGGAITVEGGRNRVRDTITRVESGTLFVAGRDSSGTIDLGGGHVTVVVHTPSLAAARADGSGTITIAALRGRRLAVEVNGSAAVRAAGRVTALAAAVDGSGDLDLDQLAVDTARLEIAGSGDAEVNAEHRLDVTLSGSGDVHYAGSPLLREDVSGSGEVSRAT